VLFLASMMLLYYLRVPDFVPPSAQLAMRGICSALVFQYNTFY
jgi:hypothetical protein